MKKLFNWLIVLGACVGAFYGIGLIVPRNVTLGSRTNLQAKPDEIYKAIANVADWPKWFPGLLDADQRQKRGDHPLWLITTQENETFELEVQREDEPHSFMVGYSHDDVRRSIRFDLLWYGEGGRVRVTATQDTIDPWVRARRFLLPTKDPSAIQILLALVEHLGEEAKVEES